MGSRWAKGLRRRRSSRERSRTHQLIEMRESFTWGEFPFTIDWPDEKVAMEGRVVLEYHGAHPSDVKDPLWHSTVVVGKADEGIIESTKEIARHSSGLQIREADQNIYLWNRRSLTQIDPGANSIRITLAPDRHRIGTGLDVDLFLMTTFSLLSMLQMRGRFVLHAAGVVSPGGAGVILVAKSDSGKSTLTTALGQAGWDFISDDSIILRTENGEIIASPFRRDFGLDPEAGDLFPGIADAAQIQLTDASKWRIDPTAIFTGRRAEDVRPDVVVVPSIVDRSTSSISRLKPADVLIELMGQSSFLTFDRSATEEYLSVLNSLVSNADGFSLEAGRDLYADPSLVAPLLEEILVEV